MAGIGGCRGGGGSGPLLRWGALGAGTVRILVGALLTFVLVIVISLVGFWHAGCPKGGLQCQDGTCLPLRRWCDGEYDCPHGDDEHEHVCLLRQSTEHEYPNFTSINLNCQLCLCPETNAVDQCVLPRTVNDRIVRCDIVGQNGSSTEATSSAAFQSINITEVIEDLDDKDAFDPADVVVAGTESMYVSSDQAWKEIGISRLSPRTFGTPGHNGLIHKSKKMVGENGKGSITEKTYDDDYFGRSVGETDVKSLLVTDRFIEDHSRGIKNKEIKLNKKKRETGNVLKDFTGINTWKGNLNGTEMRKNNKGWNKSDKSTKSQRENDLKYVEENDKLINFFRNTRATEYDLVDPENKGRQTPGRHRSDHVEPGQHLQFFVPKFPAGRNSPEGLTPSHRKHKYQKMRRKGTPDDRSSLVHRANMSQVDGRPEGKDLEGKTQAESFQADYKMCQKELKDAKLLRDRNRDDELLSERTFKELLPTQIIPKVQNVPLRTTDLGISKGEKFFHRQHSYQMLSDKKVTSRYHSFWISQTKASVPSVGASLRTDTPKHPYPQTKRHKRENMSHSKQKEKKHFEYVVLSHNMEDQHLKNKTLVSGLEDGHRGNASRQLQIDSYNQDQGSYNHEEYDQLQQLKVSMRQLKSGSQEGERLKRKGRDNDIQRLNQEQQDQSCDPEQFDCHETMKQLQDICYCELESQLKCSKTKISHIARGIVGNITILNIKRSNIAALDPDVMAEYPSLTTFSLEENFLVSLPHNVFTNQSSLENLYLSKNSIREIHHESCQGLKNLERLYVERNRLSYIDLECFLHTPVLRELNLGHNQLTLKNQSFPYLPSLTDLYLNNNSLRVIYKQLFVNLTGLEILQLQDNRITTVAESAFSSLSNLQSLSLSGNLLTSVKAIFSGLQSLYLLKLEDLELQDISEEHFKHLSTLKIVYFDTFRYCSYLPHVPQCFPNNDGVSSSRDLVGWWVLRVGVWLVAGLTVCGNVLVIFCRTISRKDNKILKLFIKNLAAADLLMGIYLMIVGVQDARTRDRFQAYALQWATSYTCTFAGILALVSSETSVFILTFMSLERYLYISETLDDRTLSERGARMCLGVIWLTSICLALFPAIWIKNFYGSNAMCFPLHINEPYLVGWHYSTFIFLGLNMMSMLVILGSYMGLFFNIRVTRCSTPLTSDEMNFALRFFFIVITNCVCWLPIMCVKLAALAYIDIHQGVYAWLVVLVLPINSAVNPGLYTFSTSQFQAQLATAISILRRIRQRQNSDTEALRHSSTRGSNLHNNHLCHNHPSSNHLMPTVPAPLPPVRPSLKATAESQSKTCHDKVKVDICHSSMLNEKHSGRSGKAGCKNGYALSKGAARDNQSKVVMEDPQLSKGGLVIYTKDATNQNQMTLSAKVTQVRLSPTQSSGDGQKSPTHTQVSPVRVQSGSRFFSPSEALGKSQVQRDNQSSGSQNLRLSDSQSVQDICLEAHLRRGRVLRPTLSSSVTSTPSFQGHPLYVDCCASATSPTGSDFQDADVLELNLKVSYSPELIRTPSQNGLLSVVPSSPKLTAFHELSVISDVSKASSSDSQVMVESSITQELSRSPSQCLDHPD